MTPIILTVGADGRVKIPGTFAGQTVTIYIEPEPASTRDPVSTRTPEEWERIKQEILEEGRRFREQADPEWLKLDHGEWLYDEDGLPK
jgi:hypothetical protein